MARKSDDDFDLEEDEGFLKPSDIPPRRRAPGEAPSDPVTEILLSSVSFRQNFNGDISRDPLSEELFGSVLKKKKVPIQKKSSRDEALAELADLHREEEERHVRLASAAPREITTQARRVSQTPERDAPPSDDVVPVRATDAVRPARQSYSGGQVRHPVQVQPSALPIHDQEKVIPGAQAEDRWLKVRWADLPDGESIPEKSSNRGGRFGKYITLALLLLAILAGGAWGTFRTGILARGLDQLPLIGNFFAASSFLVLNSEERSTFVPLFLLHENGVALRKEKALSSHSRAELDALIETLEDFLDENRAFSWLNIARAESAYPSIPQSLEKLERALSHKETFEQLSGEMLLPSNQTLDDYYQRVRFWSEVLKEEGTYLLLFGGERPGGIVPEPESFAVIEMKDAKLRLLQHGLVEDLNAALVAKYIPPTPVQSYKTALDFSESGWLFDTSSFGKIVRSLFEETTRTEIKGVFMLDTDVTEHLAAAVKVEKEDGNATWVREFFTGLSRAEPDVWHEFSEVLFEGTAAHIIQGFFVDEEKHRFAENVGYAQKARGEAEMVGFGARQWEGEGASLSLSEVHARFFPDGSVLHTTKATFANESNEAVKLYMQWYLTRGTQALSATGYSARPPVPNFDYEGLGFRAHPVLFETERISAPQNLGHLDFSYTGPFYVVGGWVTVPAGSSHTASLEYRSARRFDWQRGEAAYTLHVLRSGSFPEFPFRFQASPEEGVQFQWVDPLGFLSGSFAEYQERLSSDRTLSAVINFSQE